MNQPASRSSFTHFASKKLRREGAVELAEVHTSVNKMMTHVKRVDRGEFLRNSRLLEDAQANATDAENRALDAENRLSQLQVELESRDRLLTTLIGAATARH